MTVKETYGVSKSGSTFTTDLAHNQTYHSMICKEFNEGVREIIIKEEHHLEGRVLVLTRKREALVDGSWVACSFPNGKVNMVHMSNDHSYVDETTGEDITREVALDENGDLKAGYITDIDFQINLLGAQHHAIHEQVINKANGIV